MRTWFRLGGFGIMTGLGIMRRMGLLFLAAGELVLLSLMLGVTLLWTLASCYYGFASLLYCHLSGGGQSC